MTREALPPLLRGIGTTLILIAALVAFSVTHRHAERQKEDARASSGGPSRPVPGIGELTREIADLRAEVEEDSAVQEALENPWFEWLGFLGTATIASSFFAESYMRTSKRAKKGTASWN